MNESSVHRPNLLLLFSEPIEKLKVKINTMIYDVEIL